MPLDIYLIFRKGHLAFAYYYGHVEKKNPTRYVRLHDLLL
jgi:hypothetical protein